jgi:hypothetical protein
MEVSHREEGQQTANIDKARSHSCYRKRHDSRSYTVASCFGLEGSVFGGLVANWVL